MLIVNICNLIAYTSDLNHLNVFLKWQYLLKWFRSSYKGHCFETLETRTNWNSRHHPYLIICYFLWTPFLSLIFVCVLFNGIDSYFLLCKLPKCLVNSILPVEKVDHWKLLRWDRFFNNTWIYLLRLYIKYMHSCKIALNGCLIGKHKETNKSFKKWIQRKI